MNKDIERLIKRLYEIIESYKKLKNNTKHIDEFPEVMYCSGAIKATEDCIELIKIYTKGGD